MSFVAPSPEVDTICTIRLDQIQLDRNTQTRVAIDQTVVADYASLIDEGVAFPPLRVWTDGKQYWMVDGFHRYHALRELGHSEVEVDLHHGNLIEAQWDSFSANTTHGLRRNQADIRNIVEKALAHPHSKAMTDSAIARYLGVSQSTVGRHRTRIEGPQTEQTVRLVKNKWGSVGPVHTGRMSLRLSKPRGPYNGQTNIVRNEMNKMVRMASPELRSILRPIEQWLYEGMNYLECVNELEKAVQRLKG